MANYADINYKDTRYVDTEIDSVVIRRKFATKPGGATLTVVSSEYDEPVIPAGTLVIFNASTGVYKPFPVQSGSLGTLPNGFNYYGVVISTTTTDKPFVGVLINGVVNHKAMKYDITSLLTAVKTACPHLQFVAD